MDSEKFQEIVCYKNEQLRKQRNYYRRLHIIDLRFLDVDEYYDSLKDWSNFKAPKNTSKRDAERDSQVTFVLKIKAMFSNKAKIELDKKYEKAKMLQHEYEQYYQKRVKRMYIQFNEIQRQNHNAMDEMKSKFIEGDKEQIIDFFNSVLQRDYFSLDILHSQKCYNAVSEVTEYNEKTKILSYKYRIPNSDEICAIERFVYNEESGKILPKKLDKIHTKKISINLLETLLLRSVVRVIYSDKFNHIDSIKLTGFLIYYDKAYGNYREVNVVKLQISRELLSQINIERTNISELFERVLKDNFIMSDGLYDKEPFELSEIK